MINTYSPWAELASMPHVDLCWDRMEGRLGEYRHREQRIILDPRMPRRQQRSVLCHELRHLEYADRLTACGRVNLRQEQRANREAARLLINIRDLANAMVLHDQHVSASAVELHVSDALLSVRLHALHPNERHFLTQVLAGQRVA